MKHPVRDPFVGICLEGALQRVSVEEYSVQRCTLDMHWCLQLAAANGDMRRALEACTAALELKVKEAAAEQADMIASGLSSGERLT